MDYFGNPTNLKLIQNLLQDPDQHPDESEPDDRVPSVNVRFATPISISNCENQSDEVAAIESMASNVSNRSHQTKTIDSNIPTTLDEWEAQEALLNDEFDDRSTPEYRIVYKQSVAPEDIYFRMGNKTSATSSCEEMCLEILMPMETVGIDRMELDVTPSEIDLKTPTYRLKLPLVQQIDPDHGNANWDDSGKMLRLTLRMKRDYDFINF